MKKIFEKYSSQLYLVFRVLVGLLFLLHGWMKVSGIMSGNMPVAGLMTVAAVIEVVGGLMLIVGLLSRYVATIAAVEMVFAYFMAHASNGLSPLANKGEPAVLFFAAFLVIMAYGSKKYSLDSSFRLSN